MMIWLTLAECVAGFAGLALGSERVRRRLGWKLPHRRGASARLAGIVLLLVAAVEAMGRQGLVVGLVSWCGQLSLGAGAISLLLIARERMLSRRAMPTPRRARPGARRA
ncbi:hypothetical protein FIU88_04750 [Halomonas sp. THAF12]|uniref:DUF3325 domain-containing protein n=1 Tax=Halomonas sp. THAF12 TaxID=2587849 RepID=UPI001267FBE0|nr:DUF3325 domain-containing protein [Halomonas sp. THAF12]QFT84284.1 hypothetical protein FIU88_04750 [Halomonas sp. THAF12]